MSVCFFGERIERKAVVVVVVGHSLFLQSFCPVPVARDLCCALTKRVVVVRVHVWNATSSENERKDNRGKAVAFCRLFSHKAGEKNDKLSMSSRKPMAFTFFERLAATSKRKKVKSMAPCTSNAAAFAPAPASEGELGLTRQQLADFERDGACVRRERGASFEFRLLFHSTDVSSFSTPTSASNDFAFRPSSLPILAISL